MTGSSQVGGSAFWSCLLFLLWIGFHSENWGDEYYYNPNYLVFWDNWNMFSVDSDILWGINCCLGNWKTKQGKFPGTGCLTRIGTQSSLKVWLPDSCLETALFSPRSSPLMLYDTPLPQQKPSWDFPSRKLKSKILTMAYKALHDLAPDNSYPFPLCQACLCLLLEPPSYCLRVFVLLFPPLVLEISTGLKPSPLRSSLQCLLSSVYTDHAI